MQHASHILQHLRYYQSMNERHLSNFLALAEHLHFGRASDACNMSVSALSRHIRQLEDEVGALLFYRDNRSVTITKEGQRFVKYAREAIKQWQSIRGELSSQTGDLQGEISVYCSVTASYTILYGLLNRFREDHPSIEIKLHTGDPEEAIARVINADEDISIAAHPNTLPRGIAFKAITTSPLLFIAPKESNDLALKNLPPKSTQAWASVPMILAEGGIGRDRVDAWFKQLGIAPNIYAQAAGNEAIVSMVSLGLGIGVVPKIVLDHSPMVDRIQTLDVLPRLAPYRIGLFIQKKNLKNPLLKPFWELD